MSNLIDVGPATAPPDWCLPGTEGLWETLTEGRGTVCLWSRDFAAGVWIEAEDRIIGGRVMRSPRRSRCSNRCSG
jgi:hypothetical protein